jgi:branched-chain amino acid aminotransferase
MSDAKAVDPRGRIVWMDGAFVPAEDAKLHIDTECVMRGANVFESIKGYWNETQQQLYLVKIHEHMDRLFNVSMKVMRMVLTLSAADMIERCIELVRRNEFREDISLRPTVYFGAGKNYGFRPEDISTGAFIRAVRRPPGPSLERGLRCCVSSWVRISDASMPPRIKVGANYQNNRLARYEASLRGYDNVILLTPAGKVAEGSAACLFIVRDGVPITPPPTDGILEGITRRAVLELCGRTLGVGGLERSIDRTELYIADEVFLCGTGMEITPVVAVDDYVIGSGERGRVTRALQETYFRIVRGQDPEYRDWLTAVY